MEPRLYLCLAVSIHPAVIVVTHVLVVGEFCLTSCVLMAVSCWPESAADDGLQSFFKLTALAFSVLPRTPSSCRSVFPAITPAPNTPQQ